MAFLLGSSSGALFGSSSLSVIEQSYSPVFAEEIDLKYLYNLLPSFYRNFMSDQEVFTSVWSGTVPAISAELLNLWHINSAKSLVDIPTYTQRKWVRLPLREVEDFDVDPSLSILGSTGRFSVDETLNNLACTWQNRGGVDSATKKLRGTVTDECSLAWSFEFNLSSISKYGGLLLGYFSSDETTFLSNSLAAGIVGNSATSASLFILHAASSGAVTFRRSAFLIDPNKNYRVDCEYSARTHEVVATLVELDYEKISSTGLTGSDSDGDYYTNELVDTSSNFTTAKVTTSDSVVYDGKSYKILAIETSSKLYTELDLLPSSSEIPYTITGEYPQASVAMNIKADAGDYKFSSNSFGTSVIDTQGTASLLVPKGPLEDDATYDARFPSEYALAKAASLVGSTTNWSYSDPTSEYSIVYLPRLQNSYLSPASVLYEHVDYVVDDKLIKFQEPPPSVLYAEYIAYDEKKLYNNFGHLVGVGKDELSSEALRSKIRAMFYAYFRGPTLKSLKTGVQIHLGLPIAEEAGTVEAINLEYSGEFGQIVISGKSYLFPLAVGTSLTVGDSVDEFQVLCEGVEIIDYVNSPDWFDEFSGTPREIEKFHMFLVRLDLDAFDVSDLPAAAIFVSIIKPTWKKAIFLAFREIEDDVDIQDRMEAATTLNIYDSFSLVPDAAFSGRFFDATPDSPIDPRGGAASDYAYGSYWVSGWLPGGTNANVTWEDLGPLAATALLGDITFNGSGPGQFTTLTFDSSNPASPQAIVSQARDGEDWINGFVEKKQTSESSGIATNYYRIHIYSNPSEGAAHTITIDDTGVTQWPSPGLFGGFAWEDWSVDPSIGSEMVITDETLDKYGKRRDSPHGGYLDHDWAFDEGLSEWSLPALACARTAEENTKNLLWRDTDQESRFLSGVGTVVEGHNRPSGSTEVPGSGDSFGVRSRVVGGNLIAEMGHQLNISESITGVSVVSVPSGSTASSALKLLISADFTDTGQSSYIPVTSAGGITDEPVWPTYVSLKWSSTSDWEDDGVSGTGYSYATFKVIQVASAAELIVDTSSVADLPTSSDNIVGEVRRGGPLGFILYNNDLSNTDGCTTSDRDDFFVSSTGSLSSPDITNWGDVGSPLYAAPTTLTTIHGVQVNALDDDVTFTPVYIAFRLISSSTGDLYYGENYDYSDWVIGTVYGYGAAGDEHRLYFKTHDMSSTWFTDDTEGMQWVMWKTAESGSMHRNSTRHVALHETNSGTSCTVTEGSNFLNLGDKELIREYTGFRLQQAAVGGDVILRPVLLAEAQSMVDENIKPNDLVTISAPDPAFNGTFRISEIRGQLIGGGSSDVLPMLVMTHEETNFPRSSFTASTYLTTTGTFSVYSRPTKGVEPMYGNAYKVFVGGSEYNVINKASTLPASSPFALGVEVDHVFSTSEDLGDWEIVSYNPKYSASPVFLHDEEYLSFAERLSIPGEVKPTVASPHSYEYNNQEFSYKTSVINQDYFGTYFDYYQEMSPDEEVKIANTASPGMGLTRLGERRWVSPSPTWGATDRGMTAPESLFILYGTFVLPILGHLRASGKNGGKAAAPPYIATLSGSSDDLHIFEDLNATFTSDIPATSGIPDNVSFLTITKDKNSGITIKDWLPKITNPKYTSTYGDSDQEYPRKWILQVMEVLSDTQILLRVYDSGESSTLVPSTGASVGDTIKNHLGHVNRFHWEIRDDSAGATDRALMTPVGLWVQIESFGNSLGESSVIFYDSGGMPGNLSALPRDIRFTLTAESINGSYDGDPAYPTSLMDLQALLVYFGAYPQKMALTLSEEYEYAHLTKGRTGSYFVQDSFIGIDTFRATLSNGGSALTLNSTAAEFNALVKDLGLDGNPPYIQVAPTVFNTVSRTDPSSMIADSPVFKAQITPALEDATAEIQILGVPSSPFTITYNDGSPTVVSISDGGSAWSTVSDVKSSIIAGWSGDTLLVGEADPAAADKVLLTHAAGGVAGNSITLSTSDSSNISLPSNLSGGVDAGIALDSGTYAGKSVTDSLFVIRATTNPFPITIGSKSITDWYGQGSGDTAVKLLSEKVPSE